MLPGMTGAIAGRGQRTSKMIDVLTSLGLTTNLKLCLDAGDIASVPSSSATKWLDVSGNGYDFFRGTDATSQASDPTFNGTAGGQSKSEYWSFDGGDYFTYDTTNEAWMETLHKNSAVFTFAAWITRSSAASGNLWGDAASNTEIGAQCKTGGAELYGPRIYNGTGTEALDAVVAGVSAKWALTALSVTESTGSIIWFRNGLSTSVSSSFYEYVSPSASPATRTFQIGAGGNAASPLINGTLMANIMFWQGTALTVANLDSIFQATRSKFGV